MIFTYIFYLLIFILALVNGINLETVFWSIVLGFGFIITMLTSIFDKVRSK
jgi:hypothetical protein